MESQHFDDRKIVNKDEKPKSLFETIETIETKTRELWHKYLRPIIFFLSPIILSATFWTYLELYTVLNNMTRPVQTVTVSSEGPAAEMFPDSMGQYNVLREVYRYNRPVYKHVDRDDRFIIHTGRNLNIKVILMILFLIKVNSGTSQRICLPRRDFSRVTGKVWYQRRDGITILINMTLTIVG